MRSAVTLGWCLTVLLGWTASAAPLPIDALAARAELQQVSVSPDGRYLALVRGVEGRGIVVVVDRKDPSAKAQGVLAEPKDYRVRWCRFATDVRLLCSLIGSDEVRGRFFYITRLVAVDVDGRNLKVLLQDSDMVQGQYLDRIVHWHPGVPDTVLIEADEGFDVNGGHAGLVRVMGNVGTHAEPAVFELNVRTGALKVRQHARAPVRHWITDATGQVRLGFGVDGTVETYYARLAGESDLKRIERFEAFSRSNPFEPVAVSADEPNTVYAKAEYRGHTALFRYDLTQQKAPELVFAASGVDVDGFSFGDDGRLLGVDADTDKPAFYAVDPRIDSVLKAVAKAEPDFHHEVVSHSTDGRVFVIRATSDRTLPVFAVFDLDTGRLTRLNQAPAALPESAMSAMQPISYSARDGTRIPGYLSLPVGSDGKHLPLVVMPHGGPIARDRWGYFFLTQFLTSRGYAVLQMNFRGSGGFGSDWFFAAHQDWGGLTYDDVTDATRWAIDQGIADPKRIALVGWSFGGYIALVGAQRDADLYRCAVSIAGIGDLAMLYDGGFRFLDSKIIQRQIGTDRDKLRRDSPREHVADIRMPVLLVHGDRDVNVPIEQSEAMDRSLNKAGKVHRFVRIAGADHSLTDEKARATMLHELEGFLAIHLETAASGGSEP